jgi:hypothetical protein
MNVIKESPKKFVGSLCVSSRFVALLDEKLETQVSSRREEEVHKFTWVLPSFRSRWPRRSSRALVDGHFNGRSISKRRNNQWQFMERAKYAGS